MEQRRDVLREIVANPAFAISRSPGSVRVRAKAMDENDARGLI
jgi:hypothetical protein